MSSIGIYIFYLIWTLFILWMAYRNIKEAGEQRYRKLLGFVTVLFAALSSANLLRLCFTGANSYYRDLPTLDFHIILQWFFFAQLIALIPKGVLYPRWLTVSTILKALSFCFGCAFLIILLNAGGIQFIKLKDTTDFYTHLTRADVIIRILLLLFSIVVPLYYFLIPIRKKRTDPRISVTYTYLFVYAVFCVLYVGTLFKCPYFSQLFNLCIYLFYFMVNYRYLQGKPVFFTRVQEPLPEIFEKKSEDINFAEKHADTIERINRIIQTERPYTDPELTLAKLSLTVGVNRTTLTEIIHSFGYSGFYDYIGALRLEYFKQLACENPYETVSALHIAAGFNSRATFYRLFQQTEQLTPAEYLINLRKVVEKQ